MAISRTGNNNVTVARLMRGRCGICYEMIMPGEAYETCVGGTNTSNGHLAHFNCYKPIGSPNWENLTPEQQARCKVK